MLQHPGLFKHFQNTNFRIALAVTLLLCLITGLFLWRYGKTGAFLLINKHHAPALDVVFRYSTLLGDGLIYIPLLLYCLFFNRSFLIPSILSILICLFFTQFLKSIVFPDLLRPISLEGQQVVIHKVQGVYINRKNSFPSGHTATAFATALLLATVLKHRLWAVVLPLIALMVAYSRVYLAQHFVGDVLCGMVIGTATALLSLWWHQAVMRSLPQSLKKKLEQPVVP